MLTTTAPAPSLTATPIQTNRLHAIDLLRGLVMIIMALDHVRDFFHETALTADPLDPATTTGPLFFTRWITHFCAPVFVFLSGLSAYLSGRHKSRRELGHFLIKRGAWLVFAEVTLISFALTFNPRFQFVIFQVIWAIGVSMILLGLVLRAGYKAVLVAGLLLFFGHNLSDTLQLPRTGLMGVLLNGSATIIPLSDTRVLAFLYAVLPWTGIMFMGYAAGKWYEAAVPPRQRRQKLLAAGVLLITLFIVLRATGIYGNPGTWQRFPTLVQDLFSFLNVSKYPPSLQYAGMTLGPALIVLALTEKWQNRFTERIAVYGSVPFFYYLLHFYLIHLLTVVAFYATGHTHAEIADPRSFFYFRPVQFGFSLGWVYLIWLGVVLALYPACRWYSRYRKTHRHWWLRYL